MLLNKDENFSSFRTSKLIVELFSFCFSNNLQFRGMLSDKCVLAVSFFINVNSVVTGFQLVVKLGWD